MDEGIRVAEGTVIPIEEIQFRASRSSGPGGQHANVTASRIEAVFDVEGSETLSDRQRQLLLRKLGDRVTAVAQDARSQARNRELALERLREKIEAGAAATEAPPPDEADPRRPRAPVAAEAPAIGAQGAAQAAARGLGPKPQPQRLEERLG